MENSDAVLKQLKIIKLLLLLITVSIVSACAAVTYISYKSSQLLSTAHADSCSSGEGFPREARALIDAGKLDEAITLSHAHIQAKPNDPYGYWYRGLAHYHKESWAFALKDFEKAEKLAPSWKDEYTGTYIEASRAAIANVKGVASCADHLCETGARE